MDVSVSKAYRQFVRESPDLRVCVVGHEHRPAWWSHGAKRVLRTSCFRNEFAILDRGQRQQLLPKVYAEVYSRRGVARRSHLVEIDAPLPQPGYVPDSIFDVLEALRETLRRKDLAETIERDRAAQAKQEAREAREGAGQTTRPGVWRSLRQALRSRSG